MIKRLLFFWNAVQVFFVWEKPQEQAKPEPSTESSEEKRPRSFCDRGDVTSRQRDQRLASWESHRRVEEGTEEENTASYRKNRRKRLETVRRFYLFISIFIYLFIYLFTYLLLQFPKRD